MKNRKRLAAVLVLAVMCTVPVMAASAVAGPTGGGPLDSDTKYSKTYTYPGFKGNGTHPLQMINSFAEVYNIFEERWEAPGSSVGWHYNPDGWWYSTAYGGWLSDGWRCVDGRWYYFLPTGHIRTGWMEEGGNRFYLNPVDDGTYGSMRTGWQIIDGKAYYFNASSDGVLGALLVNTTTPDGYHVGADGALILQQENE